MISEKQVLETHAILIELFGETNGVRDKKLLDSALNRPYQTFDGKGLCPTPIDKAAKPSPSPLTSKRNNSATSITSLTDIQPQAIALDTLKSSRLSQKMMDLVPLKKMRFGIWLSTQSMISKS